MRQAFQDPLVSIQISATTTKQRVSDRFKDLGQYGYYQNLLEVRVEET